MLFPTLFTPTVLYIVAPLLLIPMATGNALGMRMRIDTMLNGGGFKALWQTYKEVWRTHKSALIVATLKTCFEMVSAMTLLLSLQSAYHFSMAFVIMVGGLLLCFLFLPSM